MHYLLEHSIGQLFEKESQCKQVDVLLVRKKIMVKSKKAKVYKHNSIELMSSQRQKYFKKQINVYLRMQIPVFM